MSRVERIMPTHSRLKEKLFNSKLADIARDVLPERLKIQLRQVIHGEKAQYPQQNPITIDLNGVIANFWIKNHSDWYRIGMQDFEGAYGSSLIETIVSMDNPYFVDVGSAQGYYSILAAKAGGKVVAVDPDPISQRSLNENLEINPDIFSNIQPLSVALGEHEGELSFYIDRSGTYAPSLVRTVKGLKEKIQVPVKTMDYLIENKEIKTPDIVKIDVEGAENLVINGMKNILNSENKPKHIFIEIHKKFLPHFGSSSEEVINKITNYGYIIEESWIRRSEILCHFISK